MPSAQLEYEVHNWLMCHKSAELKSINDVIDMLIGKYMESQSPDPAGAKSFLVPIRNHPPLIQSPADDTHKEAK